MTIKVSLGVLAQIPAGEGRTFQVGDEQVAVFHTRDGRVYATQAHCPHRQGPLADGLIGGTRLTCPLHEWTFDLSSGAPVSGDCPIKVFPVSCEDGAINLEWNVTQH